MLQIVTAAFAVKDFAGNAAVAVHDTSNIRDFINNLGAGTRVFTEKGSSAAALAVGAANAAIGLKGGSETLLLVAFMPSVSQMLVDPKLFGGLHYAFVPTAPAPSAGLNHAPELYIPAPDGFLKAEKPGLDVRGAQWQPEVEWRANPKSRSAQPPFAMVDGKKYIWVGERTPGSVAFGKVLSGSLGLARAYQFFQGLPDPLKERIVSASIPAFARIIAGFNVAGTPFLVGDVVNSVQYKVAARSAHGGFVDTAGAPRVLFTLQGIPNANGRLTTLQVTEGGLFYERIGRDGHKIWDDMSGTPVWKIRAGRPALLLLKPDFRILKNPFRRSDKVYVAARDNVAKGVQLLTAPEGRYFARPVDSEPLRFIAAKVAGNADHLQSQDRGDLFRLSPAHHMILDGKQVWVRSYYHDKDFIGIVIVPGPDQVTIVSQGTIQTVSGAQADGEEIDFKTIQGYLSSDHEKAVYLASQLSEGQWLRVTPPSEQAGTWDALREFIATPDETVQWHDEAGNWYVFDGRDPEKEVFYKVAPNGDLFTAAISIPGLVRSSDARGAWHHVPDQGDSSKAQRRVPLTGIEGLDASSGAQAWRDADGNTWVDVPRGGMTIGGTAFPQKGTWMFTTGSEPIARERPYGSNKRHSSRARSFF